MYFDWTYVILVLPAFIFSLWASSNVKNTYKRYSSQFNQRGLTGSETARQVLNSKGLFDVSVSCIDGDLTDNFNPTTNVVSLSADVYNGTSTAAIGVACHEVGHAIQHSENYAPAVARSAIVNITNFGSKLSVPLIIAGLLLSSLGKNFIYISYAGLICFGLCALFQLVTLPVEFDASHRALASIDQLDILTSEERNGAKKVLTAAALTYVAALAVSLMQLLRFAILISGRRRD